jgi:hypothetical protein
MGPVGDTYFNSFTSPVLFDSLGCKSDEISEKRYMRGSELDRGDEQGKELEERDIEERIVAIGELEREDR